MKITVNYFTSLREMAGKAEDKVHSPSTITIEELLLHLSKKYGKEFTEYLYDETGKVRKYFQILVNGRVKGLETTLKDGDTVAIFPPIGGG